MEVRYVTAKDNLVITVKHSGSIGIPIIISVEFDQTWRRNRLLQASANFYFEVMR